VMLNGAALHLFGRQFDFPGRPGRTEHFQTERGLRRELERAGFTGVSFMHTHDHFLVTARKTQPA
jgi:hypothetical protein